MKSHPLVALDRMDITLALATALSIVLLALMWMAGWL